MMVNYKVFKEFVTVKGVSPQHIQDDSFHYLMASYDSIVMECKLSKFQNSDDLEDFEANMLSTCNQTTLMKDSEGALVVKSRAFANADGFRFRGKGYSMTATAGQSSTLDIAIAQERWINGVLVILKNQSFGDKIDFQVVDKDGVYAGILYPQGTQLPVVLDHFGADWYVSETQDQGQVLLDYPARILAGLYIRVIYHSVGQNNVDMKLNLFLHWKAS